MTDKKSEKVLFDLSRFEPWLARKYPAIPSLGAKAVVKLLAEGATVPFIARYRKEQTGNLDEVAIRVVVDAKEEWETLESRRKFILEEIERQGKLTDELRKKIEQTDHRDEVEDFYLPYKQKRKTKAAAAKEAGLEPLADWMLACSLGTDSPKEGQTLDVWALSFYAPEHGITDAEKAIEGAQNILIEKFSENPDFRKEMRDALYEKGVVRTGKADGAKTPSKFESYFQFQDSLQNLLRPENTHRYLAIRRGWTESELTVSFGFRGETDPFADDFIQILENRVMKVPGSPGESHIKKAIRLAIKAHIIPSLESEVHTALKKLADEVAVTVFAENVRQLLLAAPYGAKAVLGVDPGIRTGCKVAVVTDTGQYVGNFLIRFQTEAQAKDAETLIEQVLQAVEIQSIAVGNGTFGRETEIFLRKAIQSICQRLGKPQIPVVMVSEAGASVYSASDLAREEFPELDLTIRGAISIARRFQDPLAELVKIDPKSIGVGQYQHDVSQPLLKRTLEGVVESCVNQVGVNVNLASEPLLAYVAGIGPMLAKSVIEYRRNVGKIKSRKELLEINRFSQKVFEQAAGFLRIPESTNPLDNTGIHPERYAVLEEFAKKQNISVKDLLGAGSQKIREASSWFVDQVGRFTFQDLLTELQKPGRDPRETFIPFQFREDLLTLKDVQVDMLCPGIVTNVTKFGAFVDIGVHQDGLVHISELSDEFVKDPSLVVKPGDRVKVKVLAVDLAKEQLSLSMKLGTAKSAPPVRDPNRPKPTISPRGAPRPESRPQVRESNAPQAAKKQITPRAPAQPFNNAFSALTALKEKK